MSPMPCHPPQRCSMLTGLILATSMVTGVVSSKSSLRASGTTTAMDGISSNAVDPFGQHLPKGQHTVWRYLPEDKEDDKEDTARKKTPIPTYYPTKEPDKKNKPKKTDSPTLSPTISPEPTDYPTISPQPTPTLGDQLDVPSPADLLDTPKPNPTLSPTDSPSISFQPTTVPSSTPTISTEPSVAPTDTPSASPSSTPTTMPSSSPTDSAMPSMSPIPYTRSERNNLRYTPWAELTTEQQTLAGQLGYIEPSWNNLGVNDIELLDWSRLERDQKNAARQLGYDMHSWDCWQNHYQSYRWIDLGNPYIQAEQWWTALGWDIRSWNQLDEIPESDELLWFELSDDQRAAAAQLCYFRTVWDEGEMLYDGFTIARPEFRYQHWMELDGETRDMADDKLKYSSLTWNVLGLGSIESKAWRSLTEYQRDGAVELGYTQLSWDCWQNHYKDYSWDELVFYGLDFPYLTLGWNELSWDGIESAPVSTDKSWKDLTMEQRTSAAEMCYFRDNWDGLDMTPNTGSFRFPKVKQRYVQWTSLSGDKRRKARDSFMYNRTTWDNLGTADVEKRSWEELTEQQKNDAMFLGFYQKTWDCFMNHYRAYLWEDLDRDVKDSLRVLGWNELSWKEDGAPPSYNNEWERLSENEQSVATVLCYFEDNWNRNNLEFVIPEEEELAPGEDNGNAAVVGNEGVGNGGVGNVAVFVEGGAASTDPNSPASSDDIQGQSVGRVAGILETSSGANSKEIIGTRGMKLIMSVAVGTAIQLML